MAMVDEQNTVDAETAMGEYDDATPPAALALTIAWHPDPRRVGDRMILPPGEVAVSRNGPVFCAPGATDGLPLDSTHVSRQPLYLRVDREAVSIEPPVGRRPPLVERVVLDQPRIYDRRMVDADGLLILLGSRVLLYLHSQPFVPRPASSHGLVGESAAIRRLRWEIDRAARMDRSVLIQGETGAGKELVAWAVHQASRRFGGPYVPVNAGALNPTTAVSELFGHKRGAFTGATGDAPGFFGAAEGGTLFLDEIGELPADIQPMLLRALEAKQIHRVGAASSVPCDVRVLAATDANLPAAIDEGRFRAPLYHRLRGYDLAVPPLRARRDDIPRLLLHALRRSLEEFDATHRLNQAVEGGKPWLSAARVATLMRYDWPGNVRELFNVADRVATAAADLPTVRGLDLFTWLDDQLPATQLSASMTANRPRSTERSGSITHLTPPPPEERLPGGPEGRGWTSAQVRVTLERHGFSVRKASRALDVPKTTLMRYADRVLGVRSMAKIPDEEVVLLFETCRGDVERMSRRLMVSLRAMRKRLREMGLHSSGMTRPPSVGGPAVEDE